MTEHLWGEHLIHVHCYLYQMITKMSVLVINYIYIYIIYLLTKPTADEPPITGKDNTQIKIIHIDYIK